MRLPGTKIWRAFPELDRFTDKQCAAFVKSANRNRWWVATLGRWVFIIALHLLGGFLGMFSFILVLGGPGAGGPYLEKYLGAQASAVLGVLLVITAFVLLQVPALLARDALLRRRIRSVIQDGGTCHNCSYSLLGLPIDAEGKVRCPECGTEMVVDEALGKLASANTTGDALAPATDSPRTFSHVHLAPRKPPFWTARRRRFVLRCIAYILLPMVIVAGVFWGIIEYKVRSGASQAKADLTKYNWNSAQQVVNLSLGKAESVGAGRIQRMLEAGDRLRTVEAAIYAKADAPKYSTGEPARIAYGWITVYVHPNQIPPGPSAGDTAAEREVTQMALTEARKQGLDGWLRAIADAPANDWPPTDGDGMRSVAASMPTDVQAAVAVARVTVGRSTQAFLERDAASFELAHRSLVAQSQQLARCPSLMGQNYFSLVGQSSISLIQQILYTDLPDAEWGSRLAKCLDDIDTAPNRSLLLDLMEQEFRSGVAAKFVDINKVRESYWSDWGKWLSQEEQAELGFYPTSKAELEAIISEARSMELKQSSDIKLLTSAGRSFKTEIALLRLWAIWPFQQTDWFLTNLRGTQTWLAVERYRLRTGALPTTLEQLVPNELSALRIDPYSGKPFGYKLIDPKADVQGRSYLIYSVGFDGIDQGGAAPPTKVYSPSEKGVIGFDFIINDMDR